MMGLSKQHHGELNSFNCPSHRYDELREVYSHDRQALQQIDVYDPRAYYHVWMRKYRDALKTGDMFAAVGCEAWFRENYDEL
jgi:hypothetical protein